MIAIGQAHSGLESRAAQHGIRLRADRTSWRGPKRPGGGKAKSSKIVHRLDRRHLRGWPPGSAGKKSARRWSGQWQRRRATRREGYRQALYNAGMVQRGIMGVTANAQRFRGCHWTKFSEAIGEPRIGVATCGARNGFKKKSTRAQVFLRRKGMGPPASRTVSLLEGRTAYGP